MKPRVTYLGFLLIAILIGVLEHQTPAPAQANVVIVDAALRNFVHEQIKQSTEVGPTIQNYGEALSTYIDEEILYREGVKLGLDKDDLIIRRRVVQKMRFVLEDMTPLAPPTPAQLQAWLQRNAMRFQIGASVRFQHYYFSRGKRGDEALYIAQNALQQLNKGLPIQADPFPAFSGERYYSHTELEREVGTMLADQIFRQPVGAWSQPLPSPLGVHLVKILAVDKGRLMTVQEGGQRLVADFESAQRTEMNRAGLAALKASYVIKQVP